MAERRIGSRSLTWSLKPSAESYFFLILAKHPRLKVEFDYLCARMLFGKSDPDHAMASNLAFS